MSYKNEILSERERESDAEGERERDRQRETMASTSALETVKNLDLKRYELCVCAFS